MKKKLLLTVVITAVVVGALVISAFALILRPTVLEIGNIDLATVQDGEYIGVCQNKILFAVVRVEVRQHQIVHIEVIEHKNAYMAQAVQIADTVTRQQSLEVDSIAGATFTSDTVKKAIENALSH